MSITPLFPTGLAIDSTSFLPTSAVLTKPGCRDLLTNSLVVMELVFDEGGSNLGAIGMGGVPREPGTRDHRALHLSASFELSLRGLSLIG